MRSDATRGEGVGSVLGKSGEEVEVELELRELEDVHARHTHKILHAERRAR